MSFTRAPFSVVITDATGNTINLGNASGAFAAAPVSVVITDAAGNTLNVGPGVVAKSDLTAQQANVGSTLLYTVPAGQGGTYRISGYAVITQAATTSSTLPNIQASWTDQDSSAAVSGFLAGTNAGNNVGQSALSGGAVAVGQAIFNAKAGTNISFQTNSYASSGATPMQYAIHVKLEYLGA